MVPEAEQSRTIPLSVAGWNSRNPAAKRSRKSGYARWSGAKGHAVRGRWRAVTTPGAVPKRGKTRGYVATGCDQRVTATRHVGGGPEMWRARSPDRAGLPLSVPPAQAYRRQRPVPDPARLAPPDPGFARTPAAYRHRPADPPQTSRALAGNLTAPASVPKISPAFDACPSEFPDHSGNPDKPSPG